VSRRRGTLEPLRSDARRELAGEVNESLSNLGTLGAGLADAAADAAFGELKDRRRDLLISGLAMLVLAAILGIIAWWLFQGGFSQDRPPLAGPRRSGEPIENEPLRQLTYAAVGAAALASIFGLFGVISTIRGVLGRVSA
jgi:hypothetical protein